MLFGRPHQHTREAVAAYHFNPTIFAPPTSTVVLWRCAPCREVDSQTLAGKWTLQQIRGDVPTEPERIETDLAVKGAAGVTA